MSIEKKIIFSADDFAKCDETDYAILKGFETGVLSSTCIMPNGQNYEKVINEILPQCKENFSEGGLGLHFNIIEGRSLLDKSKGSRLCNKSGKYNRNYFSLILQSFNKDFLSEVEEEFRSQIEKLLRDAKEKNLKIDHVNSHVHVHAIPKIFELVCRLTKEYGIECIRTQYENFYFVPPKKIFSMGIWNSFLNLIKNLLLKFFTLINRNTLKKYQIKTNDRFVGILTTGFMDEESILKGLNVCKESNLVVEILVHPYLYKNEEKIEKNKEKEFNIVKNEKFGTILKEKGYNLINFSRFDL